MRSIQLFASLLFFAITTCVLVLPTGIAFAQVDRAGLVGTITDPSGKVVPGVHVVAEMPDMSLRRETVSSPTGSYDIPECRWVLIPSPSIIPASKALTFVEVKQVIGQTRTLDATLQVAGGEERVEVAPSSEQIDNSTDALGGRIEKVQADTLPVNGSNWATLTALVPGAVDTGGSNQRSIRFAGRGRDDDNFTYDGIDATNIINQPQQPYVRLSIPLDTIESSAHQWATQDPVLRLHPGRIQMDAELYREPGGAVQLH